VLFIYVYSVASFNMMTMHVGLLRQHEEKHW